MATNQNSKLGHEPCRSDAFVAPNASPQEANRERIVAAPKPSPEEANRERIVAHTGEFGPSDQEVAHSLIGLMSWLRSAVRQATLSVGFGALAGAVANQLCRHRGYSGLTTALSIIGAVSVGGWIGRRVDLFVSRRSKPTSSD